MRKLPETSFLSPIHKSLGRFRSDREKTRKAEIRKISLLFLTPEFFEAFTDPFSIFFSSRREGTPESLDKYTSLLYNKHKFKKEMLFYEKLV